MPIHTQCHMNTHCVRFAVPLRSWTNGWVSRLKDLPRPSASRVQPGQGKSLWSSLSDEKVGGCYQQRQWTGKCGSWNSLYRNPRLNKVSRERKKWGGDLREEHLSFLQNGKFINRGYQISSVKWYVAHYCSVTLLISFAMSPAGPVHSWSCEQTRVCPS